MVLESIVKETKANRTAAAVLRLGVGRERRSQSGVPHRDGECARGTLTAPHAVMRGVPGWTVRHRHTKGVNYDIIDDLLAFEALQSTHMPPFDALLKTALWT